ncbi:MAG TPA: Lpg1974 family pore-forming outer membrane protein [Pirellulaceae bacterium]|nr:Lpg1974 family pore-forming outer membrane protein [Pirellulaceae bacterium]
MKRIFFVALLAGIVTSLGLSPTRAADYFNGGDDGKFVYDDSKGGKGGVLDGICDSTCGDGGFYGLAELMFMKYHRADGVRAGSFNNIPPATTDDVSFDYNATPRLTLGYVTDSGLGVRVRYWEYDQVGTPDFPGTGVGMGVDTYNIDFEAFERVQVSDCWAFELSGGLRYNSFNETMTDPIPPGARLNSFDGLGGIVGLEATRSLGRWGNLYGRTRFGILHDDKTVINVAGGLTQAAILRDSTVTMTEIAMGYEWNRCTRNGSLLFARAGYEWQHWDNFSSSFTPFTTTPPGNPPAAFAGPSDVGFSGFVFALGLER